MAHSALPSWYHKNLSRMNAEERLIQSKTQGTFLVRESESLVNTRVLSVLANDQVHHYKLVKNQDGKVSLETKQGVQQHFFESIDHLISYYEIQRDPREFPTPLKSPLLEEGSRISDEQEGSDYEDDYEVSKDFPDGENVSRFFLQQFALLKGKSNDNKFEQLVESYVRNQLPRDLYKVEMGATRPPHLQNLIVSAAADLQKSLESFGKQLELLQNLFDVGENETKPSTKTIAKNASSKGTNSYAAGFEGILAQLKGCKSQILAIEKKSYKVLKDYSGATQQEAIAQHQETCQVLPSEKPATKTMMRRKHSGISKIFMVHKANRKNKVYISINMKDGMVSFLTKPEEKQDTSNTVSHEKITQLLKDKSSTSNLGIALDKKITTYIFEDFKSRELFCLMIERMKNMHTDDSNMGLNQITVFVGSWNMGNAQPPENIGSWLKCQGDGKEKDYDPENPFDIVAIGTQESGIHEKEWIMKLKTTLKNSYKTEYEMIAKWSLWDIRLVIFVKTTHVNKIGHIKQSVVKTGIANTLGNKGAVGISFYLGNTSFCFVNCHQAARLERVAKRNQNFHDILRGLNLGQQGVFDISNHFHHLFWFGDLNYRVHTLQIEDIIKFIMAKNLTSLREYDQLDMEKSRGNAFFGFEEEVVTFRPTYRYKVGSHNMYIWTKRKPGTIINNNMPSWTDRVLWKTFPDMYIANTAYGATEDILTSDHAPVFAAFDVGLISQSSDPVCQPIQSSQKNVEIQFVHIEAKIRTSSKIRFILLFQSTCLEGQVLSKPNSIGDWRGINGKGFKLDDHSHSFPAWRMDDIPKKILKFKKNVEKDVLEARSNSKLIPALSNQRYLEDQHIQIALKGDDGHESFGECVFSLKRLLRASTEDFVSCLTHLGDESGEIRVMVRGKLDTPDNQTMSPVIRNVADLTSIKDPVDDNRDGLFRSSVSLDSGFSLADMETCSIDSRKSMTLGSTPQNYEMVGDFMDAFDRREPGKQRKAKKGRRNHNKDTGAPPVPPKKRLSKQLSSPLSPSSPQAETVSGTIWIADPRGPPLENHGAVCDTIDDNEAPPLLPKRGSSLYNTKDDEIRPPVPKPRSLHSLARTLPNTIDSWLQRIDLHQYYDQLMAAGWDDLDYLDFTESDLQDAGIDVAAHRALILKSAGIITSQRRNAQS